MRGKYADGSEYDSENPGTWLREQRLHHPFCNFAMRPREGCKQCNGLFEEFPLDCGKTLDEQVAERWPDVVKRT